MDRRDGSVHPDEFLILMQSLTYFSLFRKVCGFVCFNKENALDTSVNVHRKAAVTFCFAYECIVELGSGFLLCLPD